MNRKKNLDFSKVVENVAVTVHNEIVKLRETSDSWLDAVVTYCEENYVDIEDTDQLLSSTIKDKLYKEGIDNGTLVNDEPSLPL